MLVTQAKNEWYLSESSSFRLPDSIVHKDSFLLIFTALSGIFFVNAIQTRFPLSVGRQAFFPLGLQAGSGTGSPRAPIQTSACSWPGSAPPSHRDHRCWSAPEGCMFLYQVPDCHSGALQQTEISLGIKPKDWKFDFGNAEFNLVWGFQDDFKQWSSEERSELEITTVSYLQRCQNWSRRGEKETWDCALKNSSI